MSSPEVISKPPRLTPLTVALLAMLMLSALINYIDRQAVSTVAPMIVKDFHLTESQWGEVISVFFFAYVFCSWLGGKWADRVGVRKGLGWSTLVWSLAAAAHALATGFWSLCICRVALAMGEGPGGATLLKGVRRIMPPALRDAGTAIVGAGSLIGATVTPLIVIPLAHWFGWRGAFLASAAISILWLPAWVVLARQPNANLEAKPSRPEGSATASERPLSYRSAGVWATLVTIFCTIPPTVFSLNFLALYLNKTYGIKTEQLAGVLWQPYLAMDLGQLSGGACVFWLLRRGFSLLGARRTILGVGFLGATTMLAMRAAPDWHWAMVFLNASRFLFQFAYAALLAYGISVVAERQAGSMNGVMNATFGACNSVFALIIGNMAQRWGYSQVLLLVGIMPAVGFACWCVLSLVHDRHVTGTSVLQTAV